MSGARARRAVAADLAPYLGQMGKPGNGIPEAAQDRLPRTAASSDGATTRQPAPATEPAPDTSLDVVISAQGALFIVGWSDDARSRLTEIGFSKRGRRFRSGSFARTRRSDVEAALDTATTYSYGFWLFTVDPDLAPSSDELVIEFAFAGGSSRSISVRPKVVGPHALRDTVMGYFASTDYFGNKIIEATASIENGIGGQIIAYNRAISATIANGASVERFGGDGTYRTSIIVCLYGRHEYMFLQNALLASGLRKDVEFIYVSNSPELAESLQREARISEKIYGVHQTLVMLPGNAGFGAANNVAAKSARSDRLVFLNPDVFPISRNWADLHAEILASRPHEETRMFGVPLYYDDGSLMHGGMYFEIDLGISISDAAVRRLPLVRVEHYGKGAPDWYAEFTASRPVPAITGAFISIDRDWFETLGGFSEEYVFGHYEDADLCLKSLARGAAPWMHDIRFWHLEGKGSVRLPAHEGGSIVNRWLFSRRWAHLIQSKVHGRRPDHELLAGLREPQHPPRTRKLPQSA